ncbi:MAG: ABC transporter permease subunit [Planctomycetota bacterium]
MRATLTVAAKEIRTTFRDRQTLIYAVVLPLVMYPALFWVMLQAMSLIEGKRASATIELAVAAEPGAETRLAALVAELDLAAGDEEAVGAAGAFIGTVLDPAGLDPATRRAELEAQLDSELGGEADVALWIPAGELPLEVLFDGARARSLHGRERLEERLEALAEQARSTAIEEGAVPPAELSELDYRQRNLSSSKQLGAFVMSLMLPMMIIIMAVMGAFYPAVDLTAGERERKTEETTLLSPIPRLAVQFGKLLAVSTASGVATAMNLLGMGLAAGYLLSMLGGGQIGFELNWRDLALVAPFALPLILFVSAVLTAVASLAETFKQGQSLLSGAQMLFIFPAMATSLPGLELTPQIALLPVVGVAVAFRTILRGGPLDELPWDGLAIVAGSLLVYAAIAVAISVRLLDQELHTGGEPSTASRLRGAFKRQR